MQETSVGLIGFGSIGRAIIDSWSRAPIRNHRIQAVLVRSHQVEDAKDALGKGVVVTTDIFEFLCVRPCLVIEAAGHTAVTQHAADVLKAGAKFVILSAGALANDPFREDILALAARSGGQIVIPVGAIAGIDGLLALRRLGLSHVRYTSTKPPVSWRGTVAEQQFDLDSLTKPTTIFRGNAAEAAHFFPKNANLAATVAVAGLGFRDTEVELVADPSAPGNSGRIEASGAGSRLEVTVAGEQSASNPKTSSITGLSVLSYLENETNCLSLR
ncbi:aspartate dehydrogenase [Caballeronia sp. LjRoot34]|uniref:aspartate dehydrogenase n=1 Tax=Caballeronia sp. LjRoot34 TaxID=3342325 RepID=UPI003ECD65BC